MKVFSRLCRKTTARSTAWEDNTQRAAARKNIAGSQGVEWEAGINHFSARLHIPPIPAEAPEIVNLQSTTLGIGRLLLFAISTSFAGADFGLTNSRAVDLQPIWPLRPAALPWPPHRLLTDSEIEIIARNAARAFGVPT